MEVFIKTAAPKECINIPGNLLSWKNNQPFVLVIDGKKIVERVVKTGIRSQDKVEILTGLKSGDRIVLQPQKNIQYINRRVQ